MFRIRNLIATLIAFIYLSLAFFLGWTAFFVVLAFVLFSLSLIIFNEAMSHYKGFLFSLRKIDTGSPAELIEFMGWIILLLPLIVFFVLQLLYI